MKKTRKHNKPVSADTIARLADRGKDVSRFFKRSGRMVQPIQRVNVDLTAKMLPSSTRLPRISTSAAKPSLKHSYGKLSTGTIWPEATGDPGPDIRTGAIHCGRSFFN